MYVYGSDMKMNTDGHSKTAILIFANSPEEESRRKSLIYGTELFRDILTRTLSEVSKTGLPYFHFDEEHQRGSDFGSRFLNAMKDVFDIGYQNVIAIGADIPRISARQILTAADKLNRGEIVIGPSTDGGFYLIGLHRNQFFKQELLQLPWQKADLRMQLIAHLNGNGLNICLLKTLADLDKFEDLRRLSKGYKNIPYSILKYLQWFLRRIFKTEFSPEKKFKTAILQSHYNKGSPISALFSL